MKLSTLRPLIFAFIASALLSSCSVLEKGEFSQRKYYNFPRTNHTADGKQDEIVTIKPAQAVPVQHQAAEPKNIAVETVSTASADKKQLLPAKIKLPAVIPDKNIPVQQEEIAVSDVPVISEKRSDVSEFTRERSFYELYSSGASFILQILAAIFLPPIGVYLHDNGRTGTWFWVAMILCVAAIACFVIADPAILAMVGGICWFLAALAALLVVFDVF